jgi:hypothetical protein
MAGWFLMSGCATDTQRGLAPFDVTEPGWQLREQPVVWRPHSSAPEIEGELLLAEHRDGRLLVQFGKQWVPLISAQITDEAWSVHSSLQGSTRQGSGLPPEDILWFQIDMLPPSPFEPDLWRVTPSMRGGWRLQHRTTGEYLESLP